MAKSILINFSIVGSGIVNFDSNNQKYLWNKQRDVERVKDNNVSFGKGRFYKSANQDGDYLEKVGVISSDCIRHSLYENEMFIHLPNIMHDDGALLNTVATPAMIERGYMYARDGKSIWKRKSAFAISYAKLVNGTVSQLETYSNNQPKNNLEKVECKSETSFFKKEVRGDSQYVGTGFIELSELGFISMSDVHDRLSFDSDYVEQFTNLLSKRLPSEITQNDVGYFERKNDIYGIPELGIKLNDDNVRFLVKDILSRIVRFNIVRTSSGDARTSELKIKIVNDPIKDLISDPDGWVTIFDGKTVDLSVIDSLPVESLYGLIDVNEAVKRVSGYKQKIIDEKKRVEKKKNKNTEEDE